MVLALSFFYFYFLSYQPVLNSTPSPFAGTIPQTQGEWVETMELSRTDGTFRKPPEKPHLVQTEARQVNELNKPRDVLNDVSLQGLGPEGKAGLILHLRY